MLSGMRITPDRSAAEKSRKNWSAGAVAESGVHPGFQSVGMWNAPVIGHYCYILNR
jgi:hypothetical protein